MPAGYNYCPRFLPVSNATIASSSAVNACPSAAEEARSSRAAPMLRTLRTHAVEYKPAPTVTPRKLVRVREKLNLSRALFAIYLRTNVRTLENREQGRAKPNAQAALLINLVKQYPDTVQRLATI